MEDLYNRPPPSSVLHARNLILIQRCFELVSFLHNIIIYFSSSLHVPFYGIYFRCLEPFSINYLSPSRHQGHALHRLLDLIGLTLSSFCRSVTLVALSESMGVHMSLFSQNECSINRQNVIGNCCKHLFVSLKLIQIIVYAYITGRLGGARSFPPLLEKDKTYHQTHILHIRRSPFWVSPLPLKTFFARPCQPVYSISLSRLLIC